MAPISGNYNYNAYNNYNTRKNNTGRTSGAGRTSQFIQQHASGLTSSVLKNGSAGIGNYLNGQIQSSMTNTVDGVTDNLMGNANPYVKMAVKSAISILMSFVMGQDKKEAADSIKKGVQSQQEMQQTADAGNQASKDVADQAGSEVQGKTDEINTAKMTNDELKAKTEEATNENKELEEENKKLEEENKQLQKQIEDKQKEQKQILNEIKTIQSQSGKEEIVFGDTKPGGDQEGGTDATKGDAPMMLDGSNVQDPRVQALLQRYNQIGESLEGMYTKKTTNDGKIAANQEKIGKNTESIDQMNAQQHENYANMDAAAADIVTLYNSANGAITEFQNIISGKQKMFTPEMMIKAAEQMTMAAINGTEGGVLAAAATAMGASSVVSFGATAAEAAKYAEASGDKFSSVAPRIAAQAAIKIAEATAKSYVQQAISNISQITGVDLSAVYDMGMQVYDAAVADRGDVPKPKEDSGGGKETPPAASGSGGTPASGGSEPAKKPETNNA